MKNQNSVELVGYYGGDKTHSLSAWTSTFEELGIDIPENIEDRIDAIFDYVIKRKKKSAEELLIMLAGAGHHTPFEKSLVHFMVNSEVASHIHKLKHRIGVSINGESARYKELAEDKYYIPADWPQEWKDKLHAATRLTNNLYHQALEELTPILGRKRTKESARFFKMYNNQTVVDISFNWRSFAHFQHLRNDSHAQLEIRDIAQTMLELVKTIPGNPFEFTIKAFGYENLTRKNPFGTLLYN